MIDVTPAGLVVRENVEGLSHDELQELHRRCRSRAAAA